jgi:AcrR family transcriptional regulator
MSRRIEILRRATELFERQGVSHTSIEDIAKAVGIKREGIYYYFNSRPDILLAIIGPQSKTLLLGLRNILRTDMSSREKLRAAFENHLNSFNPTYLEMTIALREHHFFKDTEKLDELRAMWKEYGELFTEMIGEGQARGEFRPQLNAKMIAFGILGMCNWMARWFDPAGEVSVEEVVESYFSMTVDGLLSGTS